MIIDPNTPHGNAWAILGIARQLFTEVDRKAEWKTVSDLAMSGDYRHLCEVIDDATFGTIRVLDYTADRESYEATGEEKPIDHQVCYTIPRNLAA